MSDVEKVVDTLLEGFSIGVGAAVMEEYQSAVNRKIRRLRVRGDDGGTKAWGVELPSGTIVVEWRREWFDEGDRTDHPVQSEYRSIDDAEQATQGEVVFIDKVNADS